VRDHPDREHRLLACSGVSDLTLAMVGQAVAAILSAHAGARPSDRHDNALVVRHDFESFSAQIGDFGGGAP
jgi:hypothetical protein